MPVAIVLLFCYTFASSMLARICWFYLVFAVTGVYAQNETTPVRPGVKSIEEKYEWLDSWGQVIKTEKTLVSDYYPNGMPNSKLFYTNGEISTAYHYLLNNDSLVAQEEFFSELNMRWIKSDKFLYHKKSAVPYQSRDEKGTVTHFKYNEQGLLKNQKSVFKNGNIYEMKAFAYDSLGRVVKEAVYMGDRVKLSCYRYGIGENGQVICNVYRKNLDDTQWKVDKTQNLVMPEVELQTGSQPEEIHVYNQKGELTEVLASFKNQQAMMRKSYQYTYYNSKETSLDSH